ncbi:N-acetylmuramoyl-L-alanine amidase [Streptomyces sp. NPDC102394]|uniref:N-acetylmuramoyl-L-alanine amidase n=1 Tax=Streptomyces sp. NPDC102394 TaxID=3366167 RepID=UPI0037F3DA7B
MAEPLTATQLVAALKAEGCTVREVRSWRTHNRAGHGAWGPVYGTVIHHTATGPGVDVVDLIYDGDSALPGPLATGCITKDGTVHLVGNGRANHAGGGDPNVLAAVIAENYGDRPPATHQHQGSAGAVDGNAHFYGFECENKGDGKDPWPRAQYVGIVKAAAAIVRAHRAKGDDWGLQGKSAIGHLEWSDWKPDPKGFDMKDFRHDVAACLAQPAGQWPGEEDNMPTAQEIADAVVAKLIADGGVLENSDLHRIWYADEIPAARPPYNNPDYFEADGKTLKNTTWTAKYAIQTIVENGRQTLAVVQQLHDGQGGAPVTDEQMAQLGAALAASPAFADALAEALAGKLAARLQS